MELVFVPYPSFLPVPTILELTPPASSLHRLIAFVPKILDNTTILPFHRQTRPTAPKRVPHSSIVAEMPSGNVITEVPSGNDLVCRERLGQSPADALSGRGPGEGQLQVARPETFLQRLDVQRARRSVKESVTKCTGMCCGGSLSHVGGRGGGWEEEGSGETFAVRGVVLQQKQSQAAPSTNHVGRWVVGRGGEIVGGGGEEGSGEGYYYSHEGWKYSHESGTPSLLWTWRGLSLCYKNIGV